jgi:hypothetical protein
VLLRRRRGATPIGTKGVAPQARGMSPQALTPFRASDLPALPRDQQAIPLNPPSQAKGEIKLTPFGTKGVAPQARGDVAAGERDVAAGAGGRCRMR